MQKRRRIALFYKARWAFITGLVLLSAVAVAVLGIGAPEDRASTAAQKKTAAPLGLSTPSTAAGTDMGMVLLDIQTQQAAVAYHVPGRGVYVLTVDEDSPADRANVRTGDCILKVNGQEISSAAEVMEALGKLPNDESAELTILRGLNIIRLSIGAGLDMEQM